MLHKIHITRENIVSLLSLFFLFLFCWALFLYEGSKFQYLLFTISFFLLVISAIRNMDSYSYLFLAVFLWLGFWLKFTVHTIFKYAYNESTGFFIQTSDSIDNILIIASIGCWGIISARYFLSFLGLKSKTDVDLMNNIKIPLFYKNYRKPTLFCLIMTFLLINAVNVTAGILQLGLVPRTILQWPLNALFSWLLGIGFALMITTILWWELGEEKKASKLFIYSLFEPFIISVSILSRATYILHVIPVFLSFMINKNKFSFNTAYIKKSTYISLFFLIGFSFLISLQTVSWLRNFYYSNVTPDFMIQNDDVLNSHLIASSKSHAIVSPSIVNIFKGLIIDRWLGIEGVMAVSAYAPKNIELLKKGLLEKSEIGKVNMYLNIANSHYRNMDANRYIFTTIPGPIAFLYYSGSMFLVFIGMFIFTIIMVISESLVSFLTNNAFLCSLYGMDIANGIAQFGVTPSMMIKHYLLIFAYCFFLYFIQSKNSLRFKFSSPFKFPLFGQS